MKTKKIMGAVGAVGVALAMAIPAMAQEYVLRAQTHFAENTVSGQNAKRFVENVKEMSAGRLVIEMTYASGLVPSAETFSAAAEGILDIDFTGGAYQTGKNPAFQFVGDVMGGYDHPLQFVSWLKVGGGQQIAEELYNQYGMHLIGWWPPGAESLTSTKPLRGFDDLKDWKFRSPPGLETEIFAQLGASPIVMDFTEVFTALQSGVIDGADASTLAVNKGLGILDIGKHATYPGFHSMPADHLAINLDKWNELPSDLQKIMEVAMDALTLNNLIDQSVESERARGALSTEGVTFYDWTFEDRKKFREIARDNWERWADRTPEARKAVDSHISFMKEIGLLN